MGAGEGSPDGKECIPRIGITPTIKMRFDLGAYGEVVLQVEPTLRPSAQRTVTFGKALVWFIGAEIDVRVRKTKAHFNIQIATCSTLLEKLRQKLSDL